MSSTDEDSARIREIRDRLIAETGGYLHNVIREPGVTCEVCTTPVRPPYPACHRCARDRATFGTDLADLVVPVCYAVRDQQSGHLMRVYKDQRLPDRRSRTLLTLVLWATWHFHEPCLTERLGAEIDAICVVPSTRGRSGPHPMRTVARGAIPSLRDIALEPSADCSTELRATTADRFVVGDPSTVRGRTVVVVDDTWTSGGRGQSAALALRQAGADRVAVVVLTRWINPDEQPSTAFARQRLTTGYDPLTCPLGAAAHVSRGGGRRPGGRGW